MLKAIRRAGLRPICINFALSAAAAASVILPDTAAAAENPRITSILLYDDGSEGSGVSSTTVDVAQDQDCDGESGNTDKEEFGDTVIKVAISNPLPRRVAFSKFTATFADESGRITVNRRSFLETSEIPAKGEEGAEHLLAHLFTISGAAKFAGTTQLSPTLGYRTMRITLRGRVSGAGRIVLRKRIGIVIGDYDRCEAD